MNEYKVYSTIVGEGEYRWDVEVGWKTNMHKPTGDQVRKVQGYIKLKSTNMTRIDLRMDISLQKSSMFSAVRSCSRKTLIATSVPFHTPRKTSPKNPIDAAKETQSTGQFLESGVKK